MYQSRCRALRRASCRVIPIRTRSLAASQRTAQIDRLGLASVDLSAAKRMYRSYGPDCLARTGVNTPVTMSPSLLDSSLKHFQRPCGTPIILGGETFNELDVEPPDKPIAQRACLRKFSKSQFRRTRSLAGSRRRWHATCYEPRPCPPPQ